jgi:hypothetical protein
MERIRFITHQGQKILLVDCTGCTSKELASVSDEVPKALVDEPPGSALLLADFTGTQVTKEALERLKIAAAIDRKQVKRSAWVLNGTFPKPMFESVKSFTKRDIRTFQNRDEALNYLVGQ